MFDPDSFLQLAKVLARRVHDEASLRTAISRAYYSAFLTVRAKLRKKGAYHAELWMEVEAVDSILGGTGNRLRKLRNAADYADHIPHLADEASRAIEDAELLIGRFA